jgi:ABC-2 type transport system permease protein
MVLVFGLPVLMAYAFVYRPGFGYYAALFHMGCASVIIAASIGILVTTVLVSLFPAQRTRDIVILLSLFVIVCLYLLFRFLRPEKLADPDAFFSMMQYISALSAPDSPYVPTHWVTETLWAYLSRSAVKGHLFNGFLLWSTAVALVFVNVWTAGAVYFAGFSKSQEAKRRRSGRRVLDLLTALVRRPLSKDVASIMDKDIRAFFRDNTQWSQILLLAALVVVYLYNFSVLPLERSPIRLEFLQNEIAFLNMGLAGFVLSAISVRFIFPAVSSEGEAFWIVRSSPVSNRRFLWSKYALYIVPLLVLGEVLIIFTNMLLHVTSFMMVLSSVTMFLAIFGIVALAVGLGAVYPNFKCQNIAQVSTGFGGLMYMIYSAMFIAMIVVLEAGPVYILFTANLRGTPISPIQWVFVGSSFAATLVLIALATYKPMKMGLEALHQYE